MYGFEKSTKSNITPNEEKAFKIVAKSLFNYSSAEIAAYIKAKVLFEVKHEQE